MRENIWHATFKIAHVKKKNNIKREKQIFSFMSQLTIFVTLILI